MADFDRLVRPLADALRAHHLDVWYDEIALAIGDSLREGIDRGLAHSRFGIVVLSQHFFQKRWHKGMTSQEILDRLRENGSALSARGATHPALFGSRAKASIAPTAIPTS